MYNTKVKDIVPQIIDKTITEVVLKLNGKNPYHLAIDKPEPKRQARKINVRCLHVIQGKQQVHLIAIPVDYTGDKKNGQLSIGSGTAVVSCPLPSQVKEKKPKRNRALERKY